MGIQIKGYSQWGHQDESSILQCGIILANIWHDAPFLSDIIYGHIVTVPLSCAFPCNVDVDWIISETDEYSCWTDRNQFE